MIHPRLTSEAKSIGYPAAELSKLLPRQSYVDAFQRACRYTKIEVARVVFRQQGYERIRRDRNTAEHSDERVIKGVVEGKAIAYMDVYSTEKRAGRKRFRRYQVRRVEVVGNARGIPQSEHEGWKMTGFFDDTEPDEEHAVAHALSVFEPLVSDARETHPDIEERQELKADKS